MNADMLMEAVGEIRQDWIMDAHADTYADMTAEHPAGKKRAGSVRGGIRPGILRAAAAACLLLAVFSFLPLMVRAGSDTGYEILYALSPDLAQRMKPIQLADTASGIRMEVVSVLAEDGETRVLIRLTDEEGLGRTGADTDLFDAYSLRARVPASPDVQVLSAPRLAAGEEEACFLIQVQNIGEDAQHLQAGDRLTFTLDTFLSDRTVFDGELPLLPADADPAPALLSDFPLRGWSGKYCMQEVLEPGESLCSPLPGIQVTSLGITGEAFRIQVHFDRILETDRHGYPYLIGEDGVPREPEASIAFWDETGTGSYEDFLFTVPGNGLSGLKIGGRFSAAEEKVTGPWQVTFSLP